MTQAALIRAGRARAGLTLAALARRTGYSLSFIEKVEGGHRVVTQPATLIRLAVALDLDPEALLTAALDADRARALAALRDAMKETA